MQTVNIKKDQLLEAIRKNKEKHIKDFKEATVLYKSKVTEKLNGLLLEIEQKEDVDVSIHLPKPVSHENDYSTVISMLEFSTDEIIEMSQPEFRMYVLDEWCWKQDFTHTNSLYTARF